MVLQGGKPGTTSAGPDRPRQASVRTIKAWRADTTMGMSPLQGLGYFNLFTGGYHRLSPPAQDVSGL